MVRKTRVYVVEAERAGKLQYWAVATEPADAARAVQQRLGSDWHARLTDRVLGPEYEHLDIPRGRVRRLGLWRDGGPPPFVSSGASVVLLYSSGD